MAGSQGSLLESIENLVDGDEVQLLENCTWTQQQQQQRRSNIYLPSSGGGGGLSSGDRSGDGEIAEMAASPEEGEVSAYIVCFACSVIVSTITFNIILIAIGIVRRLYSEVSCQLAMSQSIVDLTLAALIMPIHLMVDLHLSDSVMSLPYFCEIWSTADVFLCTLSILHQLGMCFEKYLTMRGDNFEHFRHRFMIYTVVFVIISGSVATPLLFDCQTAVTATFVVASTTVSFYIPTCIMVSLIATISFHTFHANRCKQCAALNRDISHRHVVFNAITFNWRQPIVKHSVSMPFGKRVRRIAFRTPVVQPLPILDEQETSITSPEVTKTTAISNSSQRKSDSTSTTCTSCSSFSTVEEEEVFKAATLLALPTRLPCTRSELLKNRSNQRSSPVTTLTTLTTATTLIPNNKVNHHLGGGSYFNPGFVNACYTTLVPKRNNNNNNGYQHIPASSSNSVNSNTSSDNNNNNNNKNIRCYKNNGRDTASETQALLASRKMTLENENDAVAASSFLKVLQQRACNEANHRACFERARSKALRTTASTFICVTCWFPFFTLFVLFFVIDVQVPYDLFRGSLWLGYMNGILNPLFYILGKRKMRF